MCLEATKEKGATSQLSLELEMLRGQSDESIKDMEERFTKQQDQFQQKLLAFTETTMTKISELIAAQSKSVQTRLEDFDSRLGRMEQAITQTLSAAPLERSKSDVRSKTPRDAAISKSGRDISKSGKDISKSSKDVTKSSGSGKGPAGASGKASPHVLAKYTTKASLPLSSDDDESDEVALAVLGPKKSSSAVTRADASRGPKAESVASTSPYVAFDTSVGSGAKTPPVSKSDKERDTPPSPAPLSVESGGTKARSAGALWISFWR